MKTTKSVSQSFDILVQNHAKLKGSKEEYLEIACETILTSFAKDSSSILGPICEQLTRTTKKSRRTPYTNIAQWLHEKSPLFFDHFITKSFALYLENKNEQKRRLMGCCILIRSLALASVSKNILESILEVVGDFKSEQPSLFEMEVFNTALYACAAEGVMDKKLQKLVEVFIKWMKKLHPITGEAGCEFLKFLRENPFDDKLLNYIPLLRTDIPASSDRCKESWKVIAGAPFETAEKWIEFGLIIGRFQEDEIRSEISQLSADKNQFPSIITVALSAQDKTIQNIARALFKFGIHGQETAAFDPNTLSQILESSDDLSGIAITFLSEMALANAEACVPQLFPLLQSEKPISRKNSLELLSRILNGPIEQPIRQMIASNLLPLVGDDAITVRVDIPKLFVSVPPSFIVPSLIDLLGDKDERKRATASASINEILKNTDDPASLLDTIFDTALGNTNIVPRSPADIRTEKDKQKSTQRVMKIVEDWAKNSSNMYLDPTPVLEKFWADPSNEVIVSFISKSSPLYDTNRLLTALLTKLKKKETNMFDRLAPLLILRSQPLSFFSQRETVASSLFDLLFIPDEPEVQIRRCRGEILARFLPNYVIPKLIEFGLLKKISLFIICIAGQIHGNLPYVCDTFEKEIFNVEKEMFIPVCDAFYFANQNRYLKFAIELKEPHKCLLLLNSAFRKFQTTNCEQFIKSGMLFKLLQLPFNDDDQNIAVETLFFFAYNSRDSSQFEEYWDQMFDIASHFSDSSKVSVRFASLKLIGALITNQCAKTHLIYNIERFQHIISVLSEDPESADVRALARTFIDKEEEKPKIIEESTVDL